MPGHLSSHITGQFRPTTTLQVYSDHSSPTSTSGRACANERDARSTLLFQWLETVELKVERASRSFPMIGTFRASFSNAWNSFCAPMRSVSEPWKNIFSSAVVHPDKDIFRPAIPAPPFQAIDPEETQSCSYEPPGFQAECLLGCRNQMINHTNVQLTRYFPAD